MLVLNKETGEMAKRKARNTLKTYDPSAPGFTNAGIFGLPFAEDNSQLVILPVPWDVTVSFKAGTSKGPQAIRDASPQLDLYDRTLGDFWRSGIYLRPISKKISTESVKFRKKAKEVIRAIESGRPSKTTLTKEINTACKKLNNWVRTECAALLAKKKCVGLLGGDHSTPLGYLEALSSVHAGFGILQFDAHMDLRDAYENFTYSHASIMRNALNLKSVTKLVQVGIRDYCHEEVDFAEKNRSRVSVFYDSELKKNLFQGATWDELTRKIINSLPRLVYVSFDIDFFSPSLCPNTGTPVPGGFGFDEAVHLLHALVKSGRKVIGFDLNEVCPGANEFDANVGARILYKLCGTLLATNDTSRSSLPAEFP